MIGKYVYNDSGDRFRVINVGYEYGFITSYRLEDEDGHRFWTNSEYFGDTPPKDEEGEEE